MTRSLLRLKIEPGTVCGGWEGDKYFYATVDVTVEKGYTKEEEAQKVAEALGEALSKALRRTKGLP